MVHTPDGRVQGGAEVVEQQLLVGDVDAEQAVEEARHIAEVLMSVSVCVCGGGKLVLIRDSLGFWGDAYA